MKKINRYDPKKESTIKELSRSLESAGYVVRREQLKRGHGWKVVSGMCRANDSKLIFVDRRMSQDEQLDFLRERSRDLNVPLPDLQQAPAA